LTACWITIEEAARRSAWSVGHVRRLATGWLAEGKSQLISGGGKKPRYEVREDADVKFARVKFADQIGTDLRQHAESQRQTASDRKRLLDKWSEAKRGGFSLGFTEPQITAQFRQRLQIDEGRSLSRATLFNWQTRYRDEGLIGLIDARGVRLQSPPQADPFLEEVKRLYLSPRQLKLTICCEIAALAAAESGWEVRSYAKAKRFIAALPKAVVLLKRGGEEAYTNDAEPYLERDYSTLASNEQWCADHHQFDVIVSHGGKLLRPWLSAWMDMRSRYIVAWSIYHHDPNGDAVLASFRHGVLAHGLPGGVYLDNGKDFDSFALQGRTKKERWARRRIRLGMDEQRATGIFASLEIKSKMCWAYHGQSKPIERFFGTLEQHTPVWATYCGRSTAHKPEDLELQLDRGHAPALADLVAWFGDWLNNYHNTIHTGDSMNATPAAVYEQCLISKRTAPAELLDELLLPRTKPVKVGQNGVTYSGLRYGQFDPALRSLLGREVVLAIDPKDVGHVRVYATDGKFVCVASANQRIAANASAQDLREAINLKRQDRKQLKAFYENRPRLAEDLPDKILRARMASAAALAPMAPGDGTGGAPPSIKPFRSDLEAQLPAIRRAVETAGVRELAATGTDDAVGGFIATAPSWREDNDE
jgi:putative transposase